MERASLARPTLSGVRQRSGGYGGQAVLVLEKWRWGGRVIPVLQHSARKDSRTRTKTKRLTQHLSQCAIPGGLNRLLHCSARQKIEHEDEHEHEDDYVAPHEWRP